MGLLREIKLEISYVIFALGTFLALLVVIHLFLRDYMPPVVLDLLADIGGWIIWFVVLGPLLAFVGGWYFIDQLRKRRQFEKLIRVNSKAHFVRNQERLERIAWHLPSDYEQRIVEQKRRWKIRT